MCRFTLTLISGTCIWSVWSWIIRSVWFCAFCMCGCRRRWRYVITGVLEVNIKPRLHMWSWQHIRRHRQHVKKYREIYKSKITSKKPAESLLKELEVGERWACSTLPLLALMSFQTRMLLFISVEHKMREIPFVFLFYLVVLTGMVKKWTISLWFSFLFGFDSHAHFEEWTGKYGLFCFWFVVFKFFV